MMSSMLNNLRPALLGRTALLAIAASGIGLYACGAPQQSEVVPPQRTEELPPRCADEACINDRVEAFDVDGIHVIIKKELSPPLVVANIYFDGGARHWDASTGGHQQLALRVATEGGPQDMTRIEYHGLLERVAASIGSSAGLDYSHVSLFTPAFALDETFGLMSRALQTPAWDDQQIQNSRSQQLAGIESRYDNADNAVHEVARSLAWAGHPYAVHASGEIESVTNATTQDLQHALNQLLVREKMTVVFVGDIESDTARTLVETHLAAIPSQADWEQQLRHPTMDTNLAYDHGELRILERTDIPTNYIVGYFSTPSLDHEDYAPMVLATRILRDKLFEEVRTRRNLSYAVYSAIATRRANTGVIYVTATQPAQTLQVMYDTIDTMITDGVTPKEVENEIRKYLTHYYMDLQSFEAQAALLARWQLHTGDRIDADRFIDELRAVTPERIAEVLNQYIRNIQFGVLGHPDQIDHEQFTAR